VSGAVRLFGFGSHFIAPPGRDIDVLILHDDCGEESIRLAISVKSSLKAARPNADVVMLSIDEEKDLQFISRSAARLLGTATAQTTQSELSVLCG
jgi:hypothetical protein